MINSLKVNIYILIKQLTLFSAGFVFNFHKGPIINSDDISFSKQAVGVDLSVAHKFSRFLSSVATL